LTLAALTCTVTRTAATTAIAPSLQLCLLGKFENALENIGLGFSPRQRVRTFLQ
jgi:hypothetical protein